MKNIYLRLRFRLTTFLGRRVEFYRPTRLMGLNWCGDTYIPNYELGDFRAKIWFVRVPALWAFDCAWYAGRITNPAGQRVVGTKVVG